jgi:3-hydroxyisobutyrate dehydrogenase
MSEKPRLGFVGLGRMGSNIARHLHLDCGYPIGGVYDVVAELSKDVAQELDSSSCSSLADVTAKSDIIITVVTDDAAMRSIYADSEDNLLKGAAGKVFINCATITPQVHVEVEALVKAAGASVLEAPMASSIPQARDGSLYLMVAGEKETFERVESLLREMSKDLQYLGPAGTAAQVKALVNMVMNINTAGLAEGLGLAASLGLDLEMVTRVFSQTGANSRVLETDAADMIQRDHDPFFSAAHAAKDSGIALSLAPDAAVRLPLATATKAQYDRLVAKGLGALDKSGVSELTFVDRHGREE